MDLPSVVAQSDVPEWQHEADVVIIGLGIAGTCAALEAHGAGADVLVLERASGGGGASALSGGIFYLGGGTPVQQACGVEDDAEEMYKFLASSTGTANLEGLRLYCEDNVEHFNWLEAHGVPFERTVQPYKDVLAGEGYCLLGSGNEKVWPWRDIASPVMRGHSVKGPVEGGGAVAMQALLGKFEAFGINAIYDTRVNALVTDPSGRVVGVRARQTGNELFIKARRSVILAAGGFGMNREMINEHAPFLGDRAEALGVPENDGEGVRLGMSAGGATAAMDGVIPTASFYAPEKLIKGIVVNKYGERFIAEDSYHGRTASFIHEQPDQAAWLIVDSEIFDYPQRAQHELVDGWESIPEMESGLNLPQGSLQRTLAQYNSDAAKGHDSRFNKHSQWLKPLDAGPWAAFDISPRTITYHFITLGGLRTNTNGEVLDGHGDPVPGLLAAGACAVHLPVHGAGYASGLSLGPGSFFGRLAGRHAAAMN